MRYSKKAILWVFAMFFCFAVTGCGNSLAPESNSSITEAVAGIPSETSPASEAENTIIDDLGRKITIPENEELAQAGAIIYYFDPDAVGETPLIEVTAHLGALLGKETEAEEYLQSVYGLADELKAKIASETGIKTGVIIQAGDTLQAAQTTSGYGSMLSLLGIENIVPADLPNAKKSPFVAFDIETILESNPDLVLIVAPGKDADENKAVLEKFKNDPQWSSLAAVESNRIMILPFSVNANRSTPEDMLKTTAETILKAAK